MDIETFLQMRPTWAYQPCLYIVKQMFPGNNAHRCGAVGTQLLKQADPVYGAERTGSLTGLLGRMTMYKNYWLPLKGTLYAALRIKKQLIARPGQPERERRSGNGLQHNSVNHRKCYRPVGHGKRCVNASPPVFQVCSSGSRDCKIM